MRKLAKALGVEAMSLYNHITNKDHLLDGMVDVVFSEIEPPAPTGPGSRRCAAGRSQHGPHSTAIRGRSA